MVSVDVVGSYQAGPPVVPPLSEPEAPLYDASELRGIVPNDLKQTFDVRQVINVLTIASYHSCACLKTRNKTK